jgi:hypothetical protein
VTDISQVSETYYKQRLRGPRWVAAGGFVGIALALAYHVATTDLEASFLPIYVGTGILEGFLLVLIFVLGAHGPSEIVTTRGELALQYPSGGTRTVDLTSLPHNFWLSERTSPPKRPLPPNSPSYLMQIGLRRFAISEVAFREISDELARMGRSPSVFTESNAAIGSWRTFRYARVALAEPR